MQTQLKKKPTKILVTGSAGFIGSQVVHLLCKKNREVIGVDNLNDHYDPRLKEWRIKQLKAYNNFEFFRADVERISEVEKLFNENKFAAVINLAARAGVKASLTNPSIYVTTNILGTLALLELCKKYSVKKFVLASTSSLYAGKKMPFKEDIPTTTPISPYAATKSGAEALAYSYHYLYGIDVSVVRYFTVYGPAGRPDMSIFRFIKWAIENKPVIMNGDGLQSRDFTYVTDIADGTVNALKNVGYEIINLGGDSPHTMNEVVQLLEQMLGKKIEMIHKPFPKEDIRSTWADIKKAKKILNWSPKVSFNDGLRKTLEWALENQSFVRSIIIN